MNTNRSKERVTNKKQLACVGERKAGTVLCLRLYPFSSRRLLGTDPRRLYSQQVYMQCSDSKLCSTASSVMLSYFFLMSVFLLPALWSNHVVFVFQMQDGGVKFLTEPMRPGRMAILKRQFRDCTTQQDSLRDEKKTVHYKSEIYKSQNG